MRKPPALRPGDRLAVVAPASAFDRDQFERGLVELRTLGFEPVYDDSVFARDTHGYVAGRAEDRAAALDRAWRDPSIAGLVAVRGGYGSAHLLPLLDVAAARAHPKILLGYSDITMLHLWLLQQASVVAFQAPMLEGRFALGEAGYDRDSFERVVCRAEPAGLLRAGLEVLRPGETSGALVGGTLTQIAASLGTPWAFQSPRGGILFLEDVGERPYRLDRLVTQLRQAGVFARVSGIVLGTFPGCDEPGGAPRALDVLSHLFADFPGPVVFGLPVGHVEGPALTLPLGVRATLSARGEAALVIEEAAVR